MGVHGGGWSNILGYSCFAVAVVAAAFVAAAGVPVAGFEFVVVVCDCYCCYCDERAMAVEIDGVDAVDVLVEGDAAEDF